MVGHGWSCLFHKVTSKYRKEKISKAIVPPMIIYNGNGVDVWKIAPNQAAQIGYQHPINAHCNCAMYHHQRRRRHHHQARQIKPVTSMNVI